MSWLASAVKAGRLRWVLVDQGQGISLPGDTRSGSQAALAAVERACPSVTISTASVTHLTMYDCSGRAAAIRGAGG